MFRTVLFLNWKALRAPVWIAGGASFLLPLAAIQWATAAPNIGANQAERAYLLLQVLEAWGPVFPVTASIIGIAFALQSWSWDHQEGHIYALSLPIARWRYALMRLGAGGVLLLIPVATFAVGCLVATSVLQIPAGLQAYPLDMAVRFALATAMWYGIYAALASGSQQTTIWVLVGWIALLVVLNMATPWDGNLADMSILDWLIRHPVGVAGPINLVSGNWMLIDV